MVMKGDGTSKQAIICHKRLWGMDPNTFLLSSHSISIPTFFCDDALASANTLSMRKVCSRAPLTGRIPFWGNLLSCNSPVSKSPGEHRCLVQLVQHVLEWDEVPVCRGGVVSLLAD